VTAFEAQAPPQALQLTPALVRARRNAQLICVWCGPVLLIAVGVAVVVLAGFVPGPSPATSAARINGRFLQNLGGIRAGMCVQMAGVALIAPWGAALAVQTHRGNPATSILTVTQIVCVAVTTMIGVLAPIAWGFASFRAGAQSPELTRTLNDLAWLIFIFDWSPFAVWYASVGLAIIMDPSEEPVFPRWAAYLSFWTAALSAPGGLTILFKTGPLVIKAINREADDAGRAPAQPAGSQRPPRSER
jgi:hypothetical protein